LTFKTDPGVAYDRPAPPIACGELALSINDDFCID
jgi:hypothetical protein